MGLSPVFTYLFAYVTLSSPFRYLAQYVCSSPFLQQVSQLSLAAINTLALANTIAGFWSYTHTSPEGLSNRPLRMTVESLAVARVTDLHLYFVPLQNRRFVDS